MVNFNLKKYETISYTVSSYRKGKNEIAITGNNSGSFPGFIDYNRCTVHPSPIESQ